VELKSGSAQCSL